MNVPDPTVSVIINTLDRADKLRDTLLGLAGIAHPAIEVVVVVGPCRDHTREVLEAWKPRIRVADCPDANLARSRNIGLAHSAGDVVAFIDDDAVPHPRWIEQLLGAYRDPMVGAAGGYTIARDGVSYQARSMVCDRNGDPYFLADGVDLAAFNRPGSWLYPSLLGTNSSFRRTALEAVGGFDETFAYYLEETDLCLRLVDAGWGVAFVPSALVWHQFAESAHRSESAARRSIEAIIRSHSYFINRHASRPWTVEAARASVERLGELQRNWSAGIKGSFRDGEIDDRHASFLTRELDRGMAAGHAAALARAQDALGHWQGQGERAFRIFAPTTGADALTIAFVCRDYLNESESGIPRWTRLVAGGLSQRGHRVHVVAEARGGSRHVQFRDGVWVHAIATDAQDFGWVAERHGLPPEQAQWAASVHGYLPVLRSFGLDILSFPIWDLEGIACTDEPDIVSCMSLHTSYGISAPMRSEWAARPLLRYAVADRMIAAENQALRTLPHLLANGRSIISALEQQSGCAIASRAISAVHGCPPAPATASNIGTSKQMLFAGRFEHRKGVDIALKAAVKAAALCPDLRIVFAGGATLPPELAALAAPLLQRGQLELPGVVSRDALDALFAASAIALLPSRFESFGLVAIEAMAMGCAVLSVDAGGIAEIVEDGRTGILVPLDERADQALADAIVRLMGDDGLRLAMQTAALDAYQARFTVDVMAKEVEQALFAFRDSEREE